MNCLVRQSCVIAGLRNHINANINRQSLRSLASGRTKVREIATGFEETWKKLAEAQKASIIKEYSALEAQDWHTLTLEQKRNIYCIAYGPPPEFDPYEKYKVLGGTIMVLALGVGMFALVRSGANPAPATLSPEYEKATEEYLKKQQSNPIFGLSSKREEKVEDLKIE